MGCANFGIEPPFLPLQLEDWQKYEVVAENGLVGLMAAPYHTRPRVQFVWDCTARAGVESRRAVSDALFQVLSNKLVGGAPS